MIYFQIYIYLYTVYDMNSELYIITYIALVTLVCNAVLECRSLAPHSGNMVNCMIHTVMYTSYTNLL